MKPNLYYCDFLFEDIGLFLKGVIYNSEKKTLFFPILKTEGGTNFMPVTFPKPEDNTRAREAMFALIHANPLPEIEEAVAEKIKAAKLLHAQNRAKFLAKRELQRGKRQPYPKKTYQNSAQEGRPSFNRGTTAYTPSPRKPVPENPFSARSGFSEVPLQKKWR